MRQLHPPKLHPIGEPIPIDAPEGTTAIRLTGPAASRLAELALHFNDLRYAQMCLDLLNESKSLPTRAVLWQGAIVNYAKCFGSSAARFQLSPEKVLRDDPQGKALHSYFLDLRNKCIVHDENYYVQAIPFAIVREEAGATKVEDIRCQSVYSETLDDASFPNLSLLISKAMQWVDAEWEDLQSLLKQQTEARSFDEVLKDPRPTIADRFAIEDVSVRRKRI